MEILYKVENYIKSANSTLAESCLVIQVMDICVHAFITFNYPEAEIFNAPTDYAMGSPRGIVKVRGDALTDRKIRAIEDDIQEFIQHTFTFVLNTPTEE